MTDTAHGSVAVAGIDTQPFRKQRRIGQSAKHFPAHAWCAQTVLRVSQVAQQFRVWQRIHEGVRTGAQRNANAIRQDECLRDLLGIVYAQQEIQQRGEPRHDPPQLHEPSEPRNFHSPPSSPSAVPRRLVSSAKDKVRFQKRCVRWGDACWSSPDRMPPDGEWKGLAIAGATFTKTVGHNARHAVHHH